ncbi:hypothetical protein JH06_2308 [Blastocystis sp. subtype 4]|uniref:hypothetical protein n=1 Tax=Blastocystis sp. subtype 4 TaxID=944170 RepID=UPI000711FACE|nr:hypothetical protein JH06_2308 [Blastocystis sp. subtype 4]KNB45271.1 hypothetical protein JH06_2308 [Blastocystis sp. subtype 4]|eukprot:XP_014528714.1 hypothetical protein JH06_2308 [Blastocystis sp. subtype 4]
MPLDFDNIPKARSFQRVPSVRTNVSKPKPVVNTGVNSRRLRGRQQKVRMQSQHIIVNSGASTRRRPSNRVRVNASTVLSRVVKPNNRQGQKDQRQRRNRKGRGNRQRRGPVQRKSVSAEQLDKELNKYWEQDESVMKQRLDSELDNYYAAGSQAPEQPVPTNEVNTMGEVQPQSV